MDRIPEPSYKDSTSYPGLDLTECDDDSSVSSYSYSSSTSERRVSWSNPLVVEVRTRARTKPMDVRQLFYSYEETQRFRHEYRMERRRAAEQDAASNESAITSRDSGVSTQDSSCTSFSGFNTFAKAHGNSVPNTGAPVKHRISCVVVMHDNKLTTFVDQEEPPSSSDINESDMSISGNTSTIHPPANVSSDLKATANEFFDNNNFWNGQITWY